MARFLLIISISVITALIYGVHSMNIGGPVVAWSNQSDLKIGQDQSIADLKSLFQTALNFDGTAIAFIDSDLSAQRISSTYSSLAPLATKSAFYKSFESSGDPVTTELIQTASSRLNISPPSAKTVQNDKFTIVDISGEQNPAQVINEYINALGNQKYLLILSSPMVDFGEQQDAALVEEEASFVEASQDVVNAASQRRLQAAEAKGANMIDIRSHDLPAVLFMIVFTILLFIGLTCLGDVDTPVCFEDKTLVVNKEF